MTEPTELVDSVADQPTGAAHRVVASHGRAPHLAAVRRRRARSSGITGQQATSHVFKSPPSRPSAFTCLLMLRCSRARHCRRDAPPSPPELTAAPFFHQLRPKLRLPLLYPFLTAASTPAPLVSPVSSCAAAGMPLPELRHGFAVAMLRQSASSRLCRLVRFAWTPWFCKAPLLASPWPETAGTPQCSAVVPPWPATSMLRPPSTTTT